jgi:hypothetical protein
MLDEILDKGNIIHIAAAIFLAGFLFRDQIMLRSLVIVGNVVYVVYFYVVVDYPLWGGIFWSAVGILINGVMIALIITDRARFGLSEDERALHAQLDTLTPGEFRRLMKAGRWQTAAAETVISEEGRPLGELTYVLEGTVTVEKGGTRFPLVPPAFVGEVAFVTHRPASATVRLSPGARYVTWEMGTLQRLLLRAPSLRIGLGAAFNRDMAEKVAKA